MTHSAFLLGEILLADTGMQLPLLVQEATHGKLLTEFRFILEGSRVTCVEIQAIALQSLIYRARAAVCDQAS